MGRPDYIFGQFRETALIHNAQYGGGVCCALAPQLVYYLHLFQLRYCGKPGRCVQCIAVC